MKLQTMVETRGEGSFLVTLDGRLDSDTVRECADTVSALLAQGVRLLVFDMTKLSFISSMGIRLVLNARKKVEEAGGQVVMTNLQPQIAKVFDIAQVLPKANVFASIEEADHYYAAIQDKVIDGNQ